jgi:hypothetical protein
MRLVTRHPVKRLRMSGAVLPLPRMPPWLSQGQPLSSHLSPALRFAVILPVGTLVILAVFHISYAYVAHFTGDIQYFYILGFWGMILSFGVRRYRTVLKVNLKL